jgi:hypothetical protein
LPIETVLPRLIPLDVATKLALSLGVGLFAGFDVQLGSRVTTELGLLVESNH